MLQRKVLLQEMAAVIQELDDGTPDGALRARLCATIFLIGELPREGILVTGLRADADTLADLLVEDLPASSALLRQQIPALLAALTNEGKLMAADFCPAAPARGRCAERRPGQLRSRHGDACGPARTRHRRSDRCAPRHADPSRA